MSGEEGTVRGVITPNDQFLRDVFNSSKAFLIDIYQREYKWTEDNVGTLLGDIEVRFNQHDRSKSDPKEIQAEVQKQFEPYFINTYLTHNTPTNVSIVDGQQRLTTFLLIFIKLYQILKKIEAVPENIGKTFSSQTLEKLIFEKDDFGGPERFKIYNENREHSLRSLIENRAIEPTDESQKKIKENFEVISKYYEGFLSTNSEADEYDMKKLNYYISYILDRISIVEIKIEKQKNIAMIFEVVNDRGLGLKPYEILKGKLIGNLPEGKKEEANDVWTDLQESYFAVELKHSTETKIDLDSFFRTFFRAKFADSESDYEKFEQDYHYEMYRDPKIIEFFGGFNDTSLLYDRITNDIKYFAKLYLRLRSSYDNDFLIFNKLLDQNQQYLLIMSNVDLNDDYLEEKITGVAKKFDQFHSIIRLLDAYESNSFQRLIYPINKAIRDKTLSHMFEAFDRELIKALEENEVIRKGEVQSVSDLFTYDRFQGVRNRWTNFSKYVLMRIDRYLSDLLDKPSYAGGGLEKLEEHFNKTTRRIHGMHLEHIYAFNDSNMAQFQDDTGHFDEQTFNSIRNRLGMVLLLKDKQNMSSNAEIYTDKIETYKQSNFIWNELFSGHLHSVDERNLPEELKIDVIQPDASGSFPRDQVADRQKFVFNAIKKIWCDEVIIPQAE